MASATPKAGLVLLDPKNIIIAENARFNLKPYRVDALAQSILASGGINSPVEVRLTSDGKHELITGHYRVAAATKLNAEGAGLSVPALIRSVSDETERLKRQLSENMDRENMSPMDMAVAARKLLDAGVSRADVRKTFARPGGRKGLSMQPASNSWLNITLKFLTYPKPVQQKIHDGTIGYAAAYELGRVAPESLQAVVDRIEAQRQASIDREERDEKTEEEREAKAAESEQTKAARAKAQADKLEAAQKAVTEAATAKTDAEAARVKAAAAVKAAGGLDMATYTQLPQDEKTAYSEKLGAAKADLRGAEKAQSKATKDLDKAQRALKALTEPKAAEEKPAPKAAAVPAKAKAAKPAPISPREVKHAAAAEGVAAKPVQLSAGEIRASVVKLAASKRQGVKLVGLALLAHIDGKLGIGELETDVAVATGDLKKVRA